MRPERHNAIQSLRPDAKFFIRDDEIHWLSTDQTQPTEAEIEAELTRLQAAYDAQQYARDRATEYPTIQEQLDMQYWDSVNGTTTWADAIAQVKADNPKGAE
jgi:hypothetical protein